jgi:CRP/FNR family transcriptional regulator
MNPAELDELSEAKRCRMYDRGDYLYLAGERPGGLFCVSTGLVKVLRLGQDGREQILRLARPGDILGYRALLGGDVHSNSAVALEQVTACFVSRESFFSLAERSLRLSTQLLSLLSSELFDAEQQIVNMAHRSVRERLIETLLVLAETYGFEADGRTLAVRLSRSELAGMIGAVPESVIRLISRLRREGLVVTSGPLGFLTESGPLPESRWRHAVCAGAPYRLASTTVFAINRRTVGGGSWRILTTDRHDSYACCLRIRSIRGAVLRRMRCGRRPGCARRQSSRLPIELPGHDSALRQCGHSVNYRPPGSTQPRGGEYAPVVPESDRRRRKQPRAGLLHDR